jgi:hypothetical protein
MIANKAKNLGFWVGFGELKFNAKKEKTVRVEGLTEWSA